MKHFTKKRKSDIKKNVIIFLPFMLVILAISTLFFLTKNEEKNPVIDTLKEAVEIIPLTPTPTLSPLPTQKLLQNNYHIFQSFNNCGPASLSMTLSYYGINKTQQELGNELRPYQVPSGINDDKSVTLSEIAEHSKKYNLLPYHRPMGNIEVVKQLIAQDLPVLVRTWTHVNEDIGHFRVIKGYDDTRQVLIQDDSLQGKNLEYSYAEFNELWKKFNYEYLVLATPDKRNVVEQILGENVDSKVAWQKAVNNSEQELANNPTDIYARFNLSVALYEVGSYNRSIEEYEKVEGLLPFRTLWYQIEPILSYYEVGNYDKVFTITDKVLQNENRAFSELYLLRGKIYLARGNKDAARNELQQAVYYNTSLQEARKLLESI